MPQGDSVPIADSLDNPSARAQTFSAVLTEAPLMVRSAPDLNMIHNDSYGNAPLTARSLPDAVFGGAPTRCATADASTIDAW